MARNRDEEWAEAKRLCRLSRDELRMARALGLNPRKLIKNRPSPSHRWKAPVGEWVRELHRRRHGGHPGRRPQPFSLPPPRQEPEPFELEETPFDDGSWADPELPREEEIAEEDRLLLRRQEELPAAADYVAAAFARLPVVERVVLIGSVARPLEREVPRFTRFRRAGVALWHECRDVDLAVWVSDVSDLRALQKARGHAVNALLD
ncbi:MAG TPA: hypothetical protein VLL75_10320, partial [Vicinamibacteria bacterium]|nr:hypothetical protein [Vicinamibacteria bacterium]